MLAEGARGAVAGDGDCVLPKIDVEEHQFPRYSTSSRTEDENKPTKKEG
jgi:hypothetical protein